MLRYIVPLAAIVGSLACQHANSSSTEKGEDFRLINADALVALQGDAVRPVHLFDANHDEFRKEEGVIAGAVMLPGADYDVKATLPADKSAPLVFYCSSKL